MERLGPFPSVAALARVYSLLIHIFLSHAEYDIKLRGPLYTLYFDFVSEFRHPKDDTKTPGRAYFATTITTCSIMLASRIVRNVGSTGNKLMNEPGNNRNLILGVAALIGLTTAAYWAGYKAEGSGGRFKKKADEGISNARKQ